MALGVLYRQNNIHAWNFEPQSYAVVSIITGTGAVIYTANLQNFTQLVRHANFYVLLFVAMGFRMVQAKKQHQILCKSRKNCDGGPASIRIRKHMLYWRSPN
jgi:hypothetical protein